MADTTNDSTEAHVLQLMGKCVHFNGLVNQTCRAGVRYAGVVIKAEANASNPQGIPCLARYNALGATCERRQLPTREEAEATTRQFSETFAAMMRMRAQFVALGTPAATILCMKRGESVACSRAHNGHVRMRCSTAGCIAWME